MLALREAVPEQWRTDRTTECNIKQQTLKAAEIIGCYGHTEKGAMAPGCGSRFEEASWHRWYLLILMNTKSVFLHAPTKSPPFLLIRLPWKWGLTPGVYAFLSYCYGDFLTQITDPWF